MLQKHLLAGDQEFIPNMLGLNSRLSYRNEFLVEKPPHAAALGVASVTTNMFVVTPKVVKNIVFKKPTFPKKLKF